MQQVELKEQEKTLVYLDSMLQEKQKEVDAIKKNYTFEKDAEYQKIGNYLHPSQVIEKNLHRSYLRFQVDETGVMSKMCIRDRKQRSSSMSLAIVPKLPA